MEEAPAPPADVCWRCRGLGSRLCKPAVGAPPVPVPCVQCRASGQLSRAPPRTRARPLKVFEGWASPGPAPAGAAPALAPCEELCFLVGRWQVLQRTDSHRYSTDDVVTAWAAWRALGALGPRPALQAGERLRAADIGCGIGSVLLMTAWLHPSALCVGAEAQEGRLHCARASVALNLGASAPQRAALVQGDLRAAATHEALRQAAAGLRARAAPAPAPAPEPCNFHLVTGTPPYFSVADGGTPPHEESARCLFEYRGGVEGYCAAAAALLLPGGLFAVCQTSRELLRTYAAARSAGLRVLARVDVVPIEGKPPLFFVLLCELASAGGAGCAQPPQRLPPSAFALPLAQPGGKAGHHLPYLDMQEPAYAAWLHAAQGAGGVAGGEVEGSVGAGGAGAGAGEGVGEGSAGLSGGKQAARGTHVEYCGKPVEEESVAVVLVRNARGERTAEYRTLLWEMGKPS